MSDTIAAIATGNVISAIGIVRVSGSDAVKIVSGVFSPMSGKKLDSYADRTLVYGTLRDKRGEVIDQCLCTVSHAPKSYTGEDTAELQCHGSPTVLRMALESLFAAGARQALAGEFTKRAFLNGRMDLTQAEAVIDLIDSETEQAAKNAAGQLGGAILRKIDSIYSKLVDIISHYHAVLDYPDEDIEEFELTDYKNVFSDAKASLFELLSTFEQGKILKSGIKTAIIGRPNAGKSSLLNALLGYDRAIVTSIPGTTRDTIEESITLNGIKLSLIDTAGLRGTEDPIEKIGIDRALDTAKQAELVLAVFDGSTDLTNEDHDVINAATQSKNSIAVINKCDLSQIADLREIEDKFSHICKISAIDHIGIESLEKSIAELYPMPQIPAGEILTNSRHADAVSRALEAIDAALDALELGCTPDIVLTQTENAMNALGELTGRTVRDDVTARIFERFCVGK